MSRRTIAVDTLARVEGEGALDLVIRDGKVAKADFRIFEPPRYFEAFLRGRDFREAPDITARICGICPVAYLMGACHAMESICEVRVDGPLRELRRLLYCGEWIESHVLHMFMLHLPDFLGYQDSIAMAREHGDLVRRGLRMKKIGNALMTLTGGREIHPVNVKVGGFYRLPETSELAAFVDDLAWGLEAAEQTVRDLAKLEFPEFEQDYHFLALRHPDEYAITEGRLVSNKGVDVSIPEYDTILTEHHVAHSNSLQSEFLEGQRAHLGPLARLKINHDRLTPRALQAAEAAGLAGGSNNPFKSLLARAVETVFAFEESLRIVEGWQRPAQPAVEVVPRAGTGSGCTEAPRGLCYHRYTLDDAGIIQDAKIVAPTSVNQRIIESDLARVAEANLDLDDEALKWRCEQAIRNYDPCISCSAHFLKLTVDRG
ncbi:MAG TPA: Ni/Fe hydrogenase subunit alpha [Gammaproteobacteria bacterium]